MTIEEAKQHARSVFPRLPEEVFTLWLDGQIELRGWPPLGATWDNILRNRTAAVWQSVVWEKKELLLTKLPFTTDTHTIIMKVSEAMQGRTNEVTQVVSDSPQRMQRIADYVIKYHDIPSTLIFLSDGESFEIVDGCHRMAVFLGLCATPEFRHLMERPQRAWVGHDAVSAFL